MKKLFTLLLILFTLHIIPTALAEMVNINTADAKTLQKNLAGIGAKKAKAIVAHRKEHGDFQSLESIMDVKGIGKGIFKKIKNDIALTQGLNKGSDPAKKTKNQKKSSTDSAKSSPSKKTAKTDKMKKTSKSSKESDQNAKSIKKTTDKKTIEQSKTSDSTKTTEKADSAS